MCKCAHTYKVHFLSMLSQLLHLYSQNIIFESCKCMQPEFWEMRVADQAAHWTPNAARYSWTLI